jgi:TolB-like protein
VSTISRAVFLSYASEDTEAARHIYDALRAAGVEVWFDQSELRGGEAWDRRIREQIHHCALFIPVISARTEARDEGYFRREWKLAVDRTDDMAHRRAFLVPVVIDATSQRGASVPDKFHEVQWTRLPGGAASADFVARVAALAGGEAPTEATASGTDIPRTGGSHPRREKRDPRRRVVGFALLLVALVAVVFAWHSIATRPSGHADGAVATPAVRSERSIAVLPFVDMSENHDQEYFADGMAEELIDLLTKIPELRVIGRTSAFSFKGRADDLRAIGEQLGAEYLVEGSVRRSSNRIRVTSQLIDARTGTHVWSDAYDRDVGDVLTLQDQIASGIARALQVAVGADETRGTRRVLNAQAYTYFLRGRAAIDRGDTSVSDAKTFFMQSLDVDPAFVKAAEGLALAYVEEVAGRLTSSHVGWPAANDAARRALRLDPNSELAHAILGLELATYSYDWSGAAAQLDATLALKPRDPYALYIAAWLAFDIGRSAKALQLQDAALAIDPLNPDSHQNGAYIRYLTGDLDGAERGFRRSIEISPTFEGNHRMIGEILLQRRQPEAALKEMEAESPPVRDLGLALAYHALGRQGDSDRALARVERSVARYGELNVALVYAYRGERDAAFRWLDRAIESRDLNLGHRLKYDPIFDSLRDDNHYRVLLRKMNLAP